MWSRPVVTGRGRCCEVPVAGGCCGFMALRAVFVLSPVLVCVCVPVTALAVMEPLFVLFVLAVSDPLLILTRQGGGE